jgi:hypothetical protein
MKVKNLLTMCGVAAALLLSVSSVLAQAGGGGGGGGGRGGRGGGGGGGGGNFNPAQMQQQMQQRMMQRYQQVLDITNDTDWSAIQPLVQKVVDARQAVGGGMGRMFGGRGGRGGGNGGPGQQTDPAATALQQAIDDNAPAAQIKELLAKYEASEKTKQAALKQAQDDLRKYLTAKQEAAATLGGLLD